MVGKSSQRVKREAKALRKQCPNKRLTKIQDEIAKKEGYQSFADLKGAEAIEAINQLKRQCLREALTATPLPDQEYFWFYFSDSGRIHFFSHWIGWRADGTEIRVPSLVNVESVLENYAGTAVHPAYVIETIECAAFWLSGRLGPCLINSRVARELRQLRHLFEPKLPEDGSHRQVTEAVRMRIDMQASRSVAHIRGHGWRLASLLDNTG